jgi:hypothetical protein
LLREVERGLQRAPLDPMDSCVPQVRPDDVGDRVTLTRADDDGDLAVRRDAPVVEEGGERPDCSATDLDRQRAGDQAG